MISELELENMALKHENEKLNSLVVKAWHIIDLVQKLDMPDDVRSSIKTWCYLQMKATKNK